MFAKNRKLDTKVASVQAIEARKDDQGVARAYSAPELYVVGQAGELVQGNFGYTDRDQRYYWR
jgi:hypothetical protein